MTKQSIFDGPLVGTLPGNWTLNHSYWPRCETLVLGCQKTLGNVVVTVFETILRGSDCKKTREKIPRYKKNREHGHDPKDKAKSPKNQKNQSENKKVKMYGSGIVD